MANIIDDEVIKAEIQDGISQVDSNLIINDFATNFDPTTRRLRVYATVINKKTSETLTIEEVLR